MFAIVVIVILFLIFLVPLQKFNNEVLSESECPIKVEQRIVRGNSLYPLINSSQEVKILLGYYNCHPIERDDIIVYNYSGSDVPIIKIVKGIPNDKFHLECVDNNSRWNLIINNKVVRNSEGRPYIFNKQRYKMLSLYERDYNGVIPDNVYLILGNIPQGTMDSTKFGLVGRGDIIGKVIMG